MNEAALRREYPAIDSEQLHRARRILRQEATAIEALAERLDSSFCRAVELVERCRGCVIVSGMGKAGLIGKKISATFSSTGTPSHFVHPGEALHGDLGAVRSEDLVLALSMSGRTEELLRSAVIFRTMGVKLIAITGGNDNPLAQVADVVLTLGRLREACSLGLAPSTSTTAMLAMGDALALVVSEGRGFAAGDFARFHPGGALGRRLTHVDEVMRPRALCRIARQDATVREVLVQVGRPGRRTGAVMLVDADDRLVGIFTDSDLARLLEAKRDAALDRAVCDVMTHQPCAVRSGMLVSAAVEMLAQRKISELPVLDENHVPVGMIDITDILDWVDLPAGSDEDRRRELVTSDERPRWRVVGSEGEAGDHFRSDPTPADPGDGH